MSKHQEVFEELQRSTIEFSLLTLSDLKEYTYKDFELQSDSDKVVRINPSEDKLEKVNKLSAPLAAVIQACSENTNIRLMVAAKVFSYIVYSSLNDSVEKINALALMYLNNAILATMEEDAEESDDEDEDEDDESEEEYGEEPEEEDDNFAALPDDESTIEGSFVDDEKLLDEINNHLKTNFKLDGDEVSFEKSQLITLLPYTTDLSIIFDKEGGGRFPMQDLAVLHDNVFPRPVENSDTEGTEWPTAEDEPK